MKQFNEDLNEARRKQKRLYVFGSIGMLACIFLIATYLIFSNGTRIEVLPQEASDTARISVEKGFGFGLGDSVYSLSSSPTVVVSADGFKTKKEKIPKSSLGLTFEVQLRELPGHLHVETLPPHNKTNWSINKESVAIAKVLDIELEPGDYSLTIENPFFQKKTITVSLKRGEKYTHEQTLEPVQGLLAIQSKPSGAEVVIDGKREGVTPLHLERTGGEYTIELKAENFLPVSEKIAITNAKPNVSRQYHLEPLKAQLTAQLTPAGGVLLVDGKKVNGLEPIALDVLIPHQLAYFKSGYFPQSKTITLTAGEERTVSFKLKAENGLVQIRSTPEANILINGKLIKGGTPQEIYLPAMPHKITLQKKGYRSVTKVITPSSKTMQTFSVRLLREREARLTESPKEYTNSAGGKLKLFNVNETFTIGAARHEKGQRANEFIRTVSLTRPFYAGVYEVTNGEFSKFENVTGDTNLPVTSISWEQAAAYCNWLSKKEKLQPFYLVGNNQILGFNKTADGYRLLSEAEWEWLARNANKTKQTIFPWGDNMTVPSGVANVVDKNAQNVGIKAVGEFQQEPSGLYDMGGNVSEWVHDFYTMTPPMSNTVLKNPLGASQGHSHVVKGANWRSGKLTELRPAFRDGLVNGRDDIGFRIGRYLSGEL